LKVFKTAYFVTFCKNTTGDVKLRWHKTGTACET